MKALNIQLTFLHSFGICTLSDSPEMWVCQENMYSKVMFYFTERRIETTTCK